VCTLQVHRAFTPDSFSSCPAKHCIFLFAFPCRLLEKTNILSNSFSTTLLTFFSYVPEPPFPPLRVAFLPFCRIRYADPPSPERFPLTLKLCPSHPALHLLSIISLALLAGLLDRSSRKMTNVMAALPPPAESLFYTHLATRSFCRSICVATIGRLLEGELGIFSPFCYPRP